MKYYLDTNIWIDYLDEKREDHAKAVALFEKIAADKSTIIVSRQHFIETSRTGYFSQFEEAKNALHSKDLCTGVRTSEFDKQIAYKHSLYFKCGYGDCLHLITAKEQGAAPVSSDGHWHKVGRALGMRVYDYEDAGIRL